MPISSFLIDLLALTECTDWAVYELILDRLLAQLRPLGVEVENVEEVASLHQEAMRLRDPLTAYRALEQCVDLLCRRPARCVVLLFDEFDAVFRTLGPFLFRCLRAIHDAHGGQVSYVVVVTNDLAYLRDDLAEVEHFCRLVSRNVCGLGPLVEADARQVIRSLAFQRSVKLSAGDTVHLIKLSGGHVGLLKAIYEQWGRACTKDELIENVYRQRYDRLAGGASDEALQTLIARLREDRTRPQAPSIHSYRPRRGVQVRRAGGAVD
jgi:hypothetical protein